MTPSAPIGIFDSGVGGLTVARSLSERLPAEELVYLGDTARVPYGNKSAATVARYARMATKFLLGRGVKMIVLACNTATAYALDAIAGELSLPVLGVIEPGARAALAATRSGRIGVIGTLGTVRSGAYERAIAHAAGTRSIDVVTHACPMLVPLAEEGWLDDAIAEAIARRYLGELAARRRDIDVLVLGCTHYPLLRGVLERVARETFGHEVALVDSAESMAAAAAAALAEHSLARVEPPSGAAPHISCFVTDDARFADVGSRFFGGTLRRVERCDL